MRPNDMAARPGGDEFAVLMTDAGREEASRLARSFLAALGAPFDLDGETVLRLADLAMYAARRSKPAYAVHSPAGAELFRAA
jgi:GGDEF domain-containing protein